MHAKISEQATDIFDYLVTFRNTYLAAPVDLGSSGRDAAAPADPGRQAADSQMGSTAHLLGIFRRNGHPRTAEFFAGRRDGLIATC